MEEGFLQVDRVQSKGYESQTRLIMIANPKRDAVMDSFSFGCQSLASIYPPTLIRRTDVAVFANSGDLKDLSFINRRQPVGPKRRITPEMLRAVVYWAWNLTPDRIKFTDKAEAKCLKLAEDLSTVYGYAVDIPLINLSDTRNKLARIAAAFAVVQVSADPGFNRLIVLEEHVEMADKFLRALYSHDNCALDDHSQVLRHGSDLLDYSRIEKVFLKKADHDKHAGREGRGNFQRMIFILRTTHSIRRDDLAEQVGCSVDTIKRFVQLLKRFNLIETGRDGYVKKPKFNKFLRRFMREHEDYYAEAMEQVEFDNENNDIHEI